VLLVFAIETVVMSPASCKMVFQRSIVRVHQGVPNPCRFASGGAAWALAFALAACQASNPVGAASGASSGASSGAGGSGAQTSGGSSGGAGSTSGASNTGSPESSGATGVTGGSGAMVTDAGTADGMATDAGEADGDSAAALTLTLPVERAGMDVLEFGPLKFTVNPAVGARIVKEIKPEEGNEQNLIGKNTKTIEI